MDWTQKAVAEIAFYSVAPRAVARHYSRYAYNLTAIAHQTHESPGLGLRVRMWAGRSCWPHHRYSDPDCVDCILRQQASNDRGDIVCWASKTLKIGWRMMQDTLYLHLCRAPVLDKDVARAHKIRDRLVDRLRKTGYEVRLWNDRGHTEVLEATGVF